MRLGFFPNLGPAGTLLLEADADGLRELGETLRSLARGRIKRLVVHRLPFVEVHHAVELRATCGPLDPGVQRDSTGNSFLWAQTSAGWGDVIDKLAALAAAPQASHQPLDAGQGSVAIVASKDQYGDEWWSKHG